MLAAILLFGWLGTTQFEKKEKKVQAYRPAPDFTLTSVDGERVSLSSFKGKTVYVKFWASWCGDCIKQVVPQRHLEEELSKDTSLVFLNVSVDSDAEAWKRAIARNKLHAVELLSLGGEEANVSAAYQVDEIPHYVLIGKKGEILDDNAPKPIDIEVDYFKDYLSL